MHLLWWVWELLKHLKGGRKSWNFTLFFQELFGCKFFEKRLHGNETCTVVGSQDKAKKFKVKWFALKLESITWYTIETTLE